MKTMKTLFILVSLLITSSLFAANVATLGTATADTGTADLAIDGNQGSRWESAHGEGTQVWSLTLDKAYDVDLVKIHWEGANAKSYTLEVSADNSSWTTVHDETEGASGDRWDNISFSSTNIQYLRVTCTVRNLTYGYSFWEFEVYEAVSDAQDASLSDLKVGTSTIPDFESSLLEYTYFVESSVTTAPTVTGTPSISGASVDVTPANAIPGTTTVEVTATDGITSAVYKVNFVVPVGFPLDFESSSLNYQWGEFGAPTSVIDNPQISGINTSSKVAQVIKSGPNDWSGSFITIDEPFDLSSETRVSAKFFSPRSGINMMMKLEDASGYATAEIQVATTVANQWETLVFDFDGADVSKELVKIVVICDRATVGDGSADHTYLVDDIKLYEAPLDNESPTAFTASTDEVTYNSVEFLLNATDNSGSVTYTIEYDSESVEVTGTSGVEKSYVLQGLDSEKAYLFSVSAKDASDNVASNNSIALNATTTEAPAQPQSEYCQRRVAHFDHDAETGGNGPIFLTISNLTDSTFYIQMDPVDDSSVDFFGVEQLSGFTKISRDTISGVSIKEVWKSSAAPDSISLQLLWSTTAFDGNRMLSTFKVPFAATCNQATPVNIQNQTQANPVLAFPNPVEDILTVNVGENNYTQLTVLSLSGQAIASQAIDASEVTIDMSAFASGVYIIELSNAQESQMMRILKK